MRDAAERKLISSKELDWTPQGGSHQHTHPAQLAHLTHAPHVSVPPSLELHETKGWPSLRSNPLSRPPSPRPPMLPLAPHPPVSGQMSLHTSSSWRITYTPHWRFPSAITELCTHIHLSHHFQHVITFSQQIRILTLIICLLTKLQAPHHSPSISHGLWPAIPDHKANTSPQNLWELRMKFFWFCKEGNRGSERWSHLP